MVEVATVTSKGQITLPASIRRRLGLRKGSKIIFVEEEEGIRVLSESDLSKRFAVFERRAREVGLTPARLQALVKEARDRLWRKHYADRR
jgi:AbrB family looped-hinge helix DNA binding protein